MTEEERYQSQQRYYKILILMVGIICVMLSGFVLIQIKTIIMPLILALIFTIVLSPILSWFEKKHVPNVISYILVVFVTFLLLFVIGHVINRNIQSFLTNIGQYEGRMRSIFDSVVAFFGIDPNSIGRRGTALSQNPQIAAIFENISIRNIVAGILGSISTILSNTVLVLLFLVFLLIGRNGLIHKLDIAFTAAFSARMQEIIKKINQQINKYVITKSLISLLTGTLVAITLGLFGVEFAFIWGLLTFLLNFIPNIGSIIATIFPITFALVQFENPIIVIWIAVLLLAIQFLIGNVLEPRIVGKSMGISPVVVLFALIFWGYVWGIIGMVLAVPFAVIIKIILENIPELRSLSVLMSDQKA